MAMGRRSSYMRHQTIRSRSRPATVEPAVRAEWCAQRPESSECPLPSKCVRAAARTFLVVERRIGSRQQIGQHRTLRFRADGSDAQRQRVASLRSLVVLLDTGLNARANQLRGLVGIHVDEGDELVTAE